METKTMAKIPATTPVAIDLTVTGHMSHETRQTIERLAYALEHQHAKCDGIGECGRKCGLAAGHPGEIHEEYAWGTAYRFRLTGEVIPTGRK